MLYQRKDKITTFCRSAFFFGENLGSKLRLEYNFENKYAHDLEGGDADFEHVDGDDGLSCSVEGVRALLENGHQLTRHI